MLGFLLFYITSFKSSNKSISSILPADQTIAYIQVQNTSLPSKFINDTDWRPEMLEAELQRFFGIEEKNIIKNWGQGSLGAIWLNESPAKEPILFIHSSHKNELLEFFKGLALPNEILNETNKGDLTIYSYPESHSFHFTFVGSYVLVSKNQSGLHHIYNTYVGEEDALLDNEAFKKSKSNLPKMDWMEGYINVKEIGLSKIGENLQLLKPLSHIIHHTSWTVRKSSNGFQVNTFTHLTPDVLELKKGHTDSKRFAYELTEYISSENIIGYIGGANLSDEWQSTLETIANLNPAYAIIFEGILRGQVSKIFGSEVTLRNDLYPLFEGEYALAFSEQENGQIGTQLLLGHNDADFTKAKMEKLAKGFKLLAAKFAPRVHTVLLPDNTESKELIADDEKLRETTKEYEGYEINCLEVTDSPYGFCYVVMDDLVAMANNYNAIESTVNLLTSSKHVFAQYQPFRQTLGHLSKVSDEITFVDLEKITPYLLDNTYGNFLMPVLNKLEATTWVKHYFNDGVSVEGFLLFN